MFHYYLNQSINQHELAMAPHIQSSGAPEIQCKYNSLHLYSIAEVLYIIILCYLIKFIQSRMCVCHMFIKVLTYLLTYCLQVCYRLG